jgi:competence protein ComEA
VVAQKDEEAVARQRLAGIFDQQPAKRAAWDNAAPFSVSPGDTQVSPYSPVMGAVATGDAAADTERWTAVAPAPVPDKAGIPGKVWQFTRSHLGAVGLVLLTGCLWAGYSITQARSSEIPITAPTVVSTPIQTPLPSATPTPATIAVHVIGGVRSPGVVSVAEGARVRDVIAAAGGLADDGDAAELNLAALALDGSQIVIGTRDAPRGEVRLPNSGAGAVSGTGKVSINTATASQLEAVPGIGPVTAQRIIAWREAHQRFSSLEELQEIDGIGPKTFANLADYLEL